MKDESEFPSQIGRCVEGVYIIKLFISRQRNQNMEACLGGKPRNTARGRRQERERGLEGGRRLGSAWRGRAR